MAAAPSAPPPAPPLCPVAVYADTATASSHFSSSDNSWHPERATGAPTRSAGVCIDGPGAWSPASAGGELEWLRVTFTPPVFATRLEVWEAYAAPFISRVEYEGATSGMRQVLWQGIDTTACGSTFDVALVVPPVEPINAVWIFTDAVGYEAIDAVRLSGNAHCSPPLPPTPPPPPPFSPPPTVPPSPATPPPSPPWYIPEVSLEQAVNLSIILPTVLIVVLCLWYNLIALWYAPPPNSLSLRSHSLLRRRPSLAANPRPLAPRPTALLRSESEPFIHRASTSAFHPPHAP